MKVSQRLQKFNTGHSEWQYIRAVVKKSHKQRVTHTDINE